MKSRSGPAWPKGAELCGARGLLLLVSALLGACVPAPGVRFAEARGVLDRLAEQTSCSRAVQGDAKLVLSGPFVHLQGNLLYRAEAPDKLRFDLYSALGVTLSTLTTDGEQFALYDLAQATFSHGPAKTCNVQRLTRVAVPPFALVELLRGRPPVLAHDPSQTKLRFVRPVFGQGYYQLRLIGDHRASETLKIEVDRDDYQAPLSSQRLRLRSVRVEQAGRLLYRVELSDYRSPAPVPTSNEDPTMGLPPPSPTGPACDVELPGELSFSVGKKGYRLSLINEEVFHNPPAVPGVYRQKAASGVRSEFSDCP